MKTVVAQFVGNNKKYHFKAQGALSVAKGDQVLVDTVRGVQQVKVISVHPYVTPEAKKEVLGVVHMDLRSAVERMSFLRRTPKYVPEKPAPMILNLEKPIEGPPATAKQLAFIDELEQATGLRFDGGTVAEASDFIQQAINVKDRIKWAIVASNSDGMPSWFNPKLFFNMPEEFGYPPID